MPKYRALIPVLAGAAGGALLTYYFIVSLAALIAFPIVFIPHFIRYHTMSYHFDDEGVSMSWGYFFRKEIYLTYRRIQDIHVTRNIIERWMGLAKVPIQTASGTSGEAAYAESGLGPSSPDADILDAIAKAPVLLERPIAVRGDRAVVGRPPERVLELLA